jgi:hypothetical protein
MDKRASNEPGQFVDDRLFHKLCNPAIATELLASLSTLERKRVLSVRQTTTGNTPLHYYVQTNDTHMAKICLQCGADELAKNSFGKSALELTKSSKVKVVPSIWGSYDQENVHFGMNQKLMGLFRSIRSKKMGLISNLVPLTFASETHESPQKLTIWVDSEFTTFEDTWVQLDGWLTKLANGHYPSGTLVEKTSECCIRSSSGTSSDSGTGAGSSSRSSYSSNTSSSSGAPTLALAPTSAPIFSKTEIDLIIATLVPPKVLALAATPASDNPGPDSGLDSGSAAKSGFSPCTGVAEPSSSSFKLE